MRLSRRGVWVVLLLLVVFHLFVHWRAFRLYEHRTGGIDGHFYYSYMPSMVIDGDLDLANELRRLELSEPGGYTLKTSPTGLTLNKYPVGFALMLMPFFLAAHALSLALSHLNPDLFIPDGYSLLYQHAVALGLIFYGLAGAWLGYRFLLAGFPAGIAAASMLTVWFSTALIHYAAIGQMMSHVPGFFCVCLLYNLCLHYRQSPNNRTLMTGGLLAGLLLVLRPSNIVFLLYPVYILILSRGKSRGETVRQWMTVIAAAFIPAAIQMIVWKIIFGQFIKYSYQGETFNFLSPRFFLILFSSDHGLFFWSPVLVLACAGLVMAASRRGAVQERLWLGSFLALLSINASWHMWSFGHGFGSRPFLEAGLIFAWGLAYFYRNVIKNPKVIALVTITAIALNFYLITLSALGRLPKTGTFPIQQIFFPADD